MRRSRKIWMLLPMLFGLEGILAAQATLEYGLGAGRAATSTAGSKAAGAAVNGIAGALDKTLKQGKQAADSGSSGSAPAAAKAGQQAAPGSVDQQVIVVPMSEFASEPAVPARVYEDPAGIQKGMANDELVQRFGPASLDVAGAAGVRTLTYKGKSAMYELELRENKVAKVTAMNSHQSALVLPGPKQ